MINVTTANGDDLLLAIIAAALVLFVWYWVIRLAVRHALRDVGLRRLIVESREDGDPPRPWHTDPDEDP
jgi:hypothetical protein